jgi:hypothetical protein
MKKKRLEFQKLREQQNKFNTALTIFNAKSGKNNKYNAEKERMQREDEHKKLKRKKKKSGLGIGSKSYLEIIALGPIFVLFSLLLIVLIPPTYVLGTLIEVVIKIHYPIFNTKFWEFDIGNLFYIYLLDEMRILSFTPYYIYLYGLNYYYFDFSYIMPKKKKTGQESPIVTFLCMHQLTIQYYEDEMYQRLYAQLWSKKIITPISERQINKERLRMLRMEYNSLWVLVKPREDKKYYYSKANPTIRVRGRTTFCF